MRDDILKTRLETATEILAALASNPDYSVCFDPPAETARPEVYIPHVVEMAIRVADHLILTVQATKLGHFESKADDGNG